MKVEFIFEKETKNTYRFKAVEDEAAIETLYIKKTTIKEMGMTTKDKLIISIERGGAIDWVKNALIAFADAKGKNIKY